MNNIYFISDAHLSFTDSESEREKKGKLLRFLDHIRTEGNTRELYLVGDIFDFWFEWYHVVPKYCFPVLFRFRQLVESGIPVTFISGNHDFHFGRYLENEVGIRCFDESMEFEAEGKRFFVGHGDGYAKNDRGYRLLKKIIRNRVSIFLYKTFIPADLGVQIARWTSHTSRKVVKIEKHSWAEEYYQFARGKFDAGFDYVVLGHIHYPMIREDEGNGKTYINCGDWITQFTYGKYDGSRLTLNRWETGDG
ncbi:MAG: UDP-2,3-diacylglucosamine diphosphatase [bacterium]|nr:UDP-2,3-diacylglucosamine diphosphatase [bacterium]